MEAKQLIELGESVYQGFNQCREISKVDAIVYEAFESKINLVREALKDLDDVEEIFNEIIYCDLAFAFMGIGYCLGQVFDLTDPQRQEMVKTVMKVIREKGLLPYLPRDKKAA